MAISALPSIKTVFSLLKEINLEHIRQSSNEPFEIVLTGEKASLVAQHLESPRVRVGSDTRHAGLKIYVLRSQAQKTYVQEEALDVSVIGETAFLPTSLNQVVLTNWSEESLKNELLPVLLNRLPEHLQLGIARHVPLARSVYNKQLVDETSKANALYAASTAFAEIIPVLNIPLNVADSIVLTKNQLVMAYKLALAAGKTGTPNSVMTEIIGVLGSGFLMRQAARSLVGLIPAWGALPKVAVAYAGTYLVGHGVNAWLKNGQKLTERELKRFYSEALQQGKRIAKLKPSEQEKVEEEIGEEK
jgi:uncharacterized protein (DUF697 family)